MCVQAYTSIVRDCDCVYNKQLNSQVKANLKQNSISQETKIPQVWREMKKQGNGTQISLMLDWQKQLYIKLNAS